MFDCIIIHVTDHRSLRRLKGFDFWYIQTADIGVTWLGPGQLLSYFRTIQNTFITLLAGSQLSDRCPLGCLFFVDVNVRAYIRMY